jgi:tryptophan-rich sensory protein
MNDILGERWTVIAIGGGVALLVAFAGGMLTVVGPWYEGLRFPSWRPPNWLFGPAWTLIFICIATSGILAWEGAETDAQRNWLIALFAINGVFNVLWSAFFFRLRRPDWALADLVLLWLSILALIIATFRISATAGWFMCPYLAWVSFAGVLNFTIVRLNWPFRASA